MKHLAISTIFVLAIVSATANTMYFIRYTECKVKEQCKVRQMGRILAIVTK